MTAESHMRPISFEAGRGRAVFGEALDKGLRATEAASNGLRRVAGALSLLSKISEQASDDRIDLTGNELWSMLDLLNEQAELVQAELIKAEDVLLCGGKDF